MKTTRLRKSRRAGVFRSILLTLFAALFAAFSITSAGFAQPSNDDPEQMQAGNSESTESPAQSSAQPEFVPGEVIVKYKERVRQVSRAEVRSEENLERIERLDSIDAELVEVEGRSVEAAVSDLNSRPEVEYAEPNLLRYTSYGEEPRFGELWGLNNTGQTIENQAGANDVDINAL